MGTVTITYRVRWRIFKGRLKRNIRKWIEKISTKLTKPQEFSIYIEVFKANPKIGDTRFWAAICGETKDFLEFKNSPDFLSKSRIKVISSNQDEPIEDILYLTAFWNGIERIPLGSKINVITDSKFLRDFENKKEKKCKSEYKILKTVESHLKSNQYKITWEKIDPQDKFHQLLKKAAGRKHNASIEFYHTAKSLRAELEAKTQDEALKSNPAEANTAQYRYFSNLQGLPKFFKKKDL